MSERVTRRLKAARILDRAGGKMTADRFREAMGDDWTRFLRDNMKAGGLIERAGDFKRGAPAALVLTEAGYAYARGEVKPTPGWQPGQRAQVRAVVEVATPAKVTPPADVPEHVRPLLARREVLRAELGRLDAALAALGVG